MSPDDGSAGRRLALLVATATYADPGLAALRAPAGDVRSLAAVLGDAQVGGFAVRELIDRPTEELRREIEGFFAQGRPKDLLLLYVSGHGVLSQNRRFYLATVSTVLSLLRSTAIEDSFVNDVMQQSRARSIVLMLDCCHSGAFGKGLVPKSAVSVDIEHRFEGRGRITLSASTDLEYAFEESDPATGINELGHVAPGSLFTRSVVEGLHSGEADVDEDGEITVDDLYDYVCQRIRDRSADQTPGMAGDVRGRIVLAHSPRHAALSPELVRATRSNLAGIREGAVRELATLLAAGGPDAPAARAALERLAEDHSRAVSAAALAALGRSSLVHDEPPPTPVRPGPASPPEPTPPAPEPDPTPADAKQPPLPEPEPAPAGPEPRPPPEGRRRRWAVLAGAGGVAGAAVAAALLLAGGGESPRPPGTVTPYDFDGGRQQSVVLGLAQAAKAAGELHGGVVLVGRPGDRTRVLTSRDVGVPGNAGETDRFGTAVASGDFDGDGRADVALSAPGKRGVAIIYSLHERKQWIPSSALPVVPDSHTFGFTLLAARLNRDRYSDLAIGTPGTDPGKAPVPGSIHILFGSGQGLHTEGARRIVQPVAGEENFGENLSVGEIDGDGNPDLVEGGEDAGSARGGHLSYCRGTPQGPRSCLDLDGGPTTSLAIADVDGNGRLDLVQGDARGHGSVAIWPGSRNGPKGRPVVIDQDTSTIPGTAREGDDFGHDVIAADLDGDHKAEVIVAARDDNDGPTGSITLIPGASPFASKPAHFLPYKGAPGSRLGATLSLLDVNGDHHPELFAGVRSAPETRLAVVEYPGVDSGLGTGRPWAGLDGLNVVIDRSSPLRLGR